MESKKMECCSFWHKHCISWSAIVLGGLVAVALGFLANLLSLSVGLSAFPVTPEGKEQFAVWGFVGLVVLAILSMYFSGWIAGYLAKRPGKLSCTGELYGFAAWALALVITLFLTANSSGFISQRAYLVDRNMTAMQMSHEVTASVTQIKHEAKQRTSPSVETAGDILGAVTFVTFFLLFIGALSAAFGGRAGMRCCAKCHDAECRECK